MYSIPLNIFVNVGEGVVLSAIVFTTSIQLVVYLIASVTFLVHTYCGVSLYLVDLKGKFF